MSVLSALTAAAVLTATAAPQVAPLDVLPAATTVVDVYTWASQPRWERVARGMKDAGEKDPEWFKRHTAKAAGGPLPYDARFGVPRAEYEAFLAAGSDVLELKKIGRAKLGVETRSDAVLYALSNSVVMEMGLYLDRATQKLTMPQIGVAPAPSAVTHQLKAFGGAYRGAAWNVSEPGDTVARKGEVVAMRLDGEPGTCALSASFKKRVREQFVIREDFVVKYPCPKKAAAH